MSLWRMLDSAFCLQLTLTLGHFLWQGVVIGLLAVLSTWCLRRRSAQIRYQVHLWAMLLMAACLPVTFALVCHAELSSMPTRPAIAAAPPRHIPIAESPLAPPTGVIEPSTVSPPPETVPGVQAARPVHSEAPTASLGRTPAPPPTPLSTPDDPETGSAASGIRWQSLQPYAVMGYFSGVLVMLTRLLVALRGGRRLRRDAVLIEDEGVLAAVQTQAERLGLRLVPVVAYCRRVALPVVVGVLKPVILLPASLASGLTPDQINVILTHELIHVRRHDPLVNLLQRVIEAVLFFHPAVWYVSRQIRIEREHCCDDLVVAGGVEPSRYAESLVRAAELSDQALAGVPAAAIAVSGGRPSRLRTRVLRLLGGPRDPQFRLSGTGGWAITLALAAGVAALVLAGGPAERAEASEPLRATLPGGVTVALVGVAEHPSGGRWWNPTGAPLAEPPYDKFGGATVRSQDRQSYELALRVAGLAQDRRTTWQIVPDPAAFTIWSPAESDLGAPALRAMAAAVPKALKTLAMRFGVTTEAWETILIVDRSANVLADRSPSTLAIKGIGVEPLNGPYELTLTHATGSLSGWHLRVVGLSYDGTSHVHEQVSTQVIRSHLQQTAYRLPSFPSGLRELWVQLRPYEYWVTFRNVSLAPGRRTKAEVEVEQCLDLSRERFAERVAERVTEAIWLWQIDGIKKEDIELLHDQFRKVVIEHGPERSSHAWQASILEGVDRHFGPYVPTLTKKGRYHSAYLYHLPLLMKNLRWTLYLALRQEPLDEAALGRRRSQRDWMRSYVKTLPDERSPLSGRLMHTVARGLSDLQGKLEDPLNLAFRRPMSDAQFKDFRTRVQEHKLGKRVTSVAFIMEHLAREIQFSREVSFGGSFEEAMAAHGQKDKLVRVWFVFPTARSFSQTHSLFGMAEHGGIWDLGEGKAFLVPVPVCEAGRDAVDRWATQQGKGDVGYDRASRQLLALRGARIAEIEADDWDEVDRTPHAELCRRVERHGKPAFSLSNLIESSRAGDTWPHHDVFLGVLHDEGRLSILQIKALAGTLEMRIRGHEPETLASPFSPGYTPAPNAWARIDEGDLQTEPIAQLARIKRLYGVFPPDRTSPDAPKLVNEQLVFPPDDTSWEDPRTSRPQMRLSPDGRYLLYRRQRALMLRDLASGKDLVVPAAPNGESHLTVSVRYNPFDPEGKRLLLHTGGGFCVYEIGREAAEPTVFGNGFLPVKFDRTGTKLIVTRAHVSGIATATLPDLKLDPVTSGPAGWLQSVCPTADLVCLFGGPGGKELTIYDVAAKKPVATLPLHQHNGHTDDRETQWTRDGRYFYYYDIKRLDETIHTAELVTRVWDRETGELAEVGDVGLPIGPGPTPTTMVLAKGKPLQTYMLLHDADSGKVWPLSDSTLQLQHAAGKVVYVKRSLDGATRSVHTAEISMPD